MRKFRRFWGYAKKAIVAGGGVAVSVILAQHGLEVPPEVTTEVISNVVEGVSAGLGIGAVVYRVSNDP